MFPPRTPLLVLLVLAVGTAGCSTKRTLILDSDPPGARVFVDGKFLGKAPVEVPFVHPGAFQVRMELAGHRSVAQEVHVKSEIGDLPVIDLPVEMLTPEKRWRTVLHLEPISARPDEAELRGVLERARAFRERTRTEANVPGVTPTVPRVPGQPGGGGR